MLLYSIWSLSPASRLVILHLRKKGDSETTFITNKAVKNVFAVAMSDPPIIYY